MANIRQDARKARFVLTRWRQIPYSAKKSYLRTLKFFPGDGRIGGWEWFSTLKEPDKTYAISPDGRWFVGDAGCA